MTDFQDELSKYIIKEKYARYLPSKKRRENWGEASTRVENMHLGYFGNILTEEDKTEVRWAFDQVREMNGVPSMRSLQFGGPAMLAHEARGYNCAGRHVDSTRAFAEIFYLLLCGCGVGIGLNKKLASRLPSLVTAANKTGTVLTYVIEDTIEGWADSVQILLECYLKNTPFTGRKIVFDYSKIRKKGAPLKTGGGKAPGHVPLKKAHTAIKELLDYIIEVEGVKRLRGIHIYDILMHCADAVISGGVRRAATNTIFDASDDEMLTAKTVIPVALKSLVKTYKKKNKSTNSLEEKYEILVEYKGKLRTLTMSKWEYDQLTETGKVSWIHVEPQRARSNNSVLFLRKEVTYEQFLKVIESSRQWGEPGFVFADHEFSMMNPCFTKDTRVLTEAGWRTFENILGTSPTIVQDNRVQGHLVNDTETWTFGLTATGTTSNLSPSVKQTGTNQPVFKLTLTCGREVTATANHHFATTRGMVELQHLVKDDNILIALPEPTEILLDDDYRFGFLAGLIWGDGCISGTSANVDIWEKPGERNQIELVEKIVQELGITARFGGSPKFSTPKQTSVYDRYRMSSADLLRQLTARYSFAKDDLDWLHYTSKSFKAAFFAGVFESDGHIERRSISMVLTSINVTAIRNLQLICQELGVLSYVSNGLPPRVTKFATGEYPCKQTYRLKIHGLKNCMIMNDCLLYDTIKKRRLLDVASTFTTTGYKRRATSKVVSVVPAGTEDVYCLQEDVRRTLVANGMTARRCFEISWLPVTEDGICGVQLCNLSSINGTRVKTLPDFKNAIKAATIIGTLQAAYTNFPYLSDACRQLTEEEALLGVSITGVLDSPEFLLNPDNLMIGAKYALDVNEEWAKKLGINPAARVTCIKPEGTTTLVLKSFGSGANPSHGGPNYLRRVQANKNSNVYNHFKASNPDATEESVWSANNTDDVISFPLTVPEGVLTKDDITAIQHLDHIKTLQKYWVNAGTSEHNKKPVRHSVSCTVLVDDGDWEKVCKYLYKNRNFFSAVALLPRMGDKMYPQAPNERMTTPEELEVFKKLQDGWISVDYDLLVEDDDATEIVQAVACGGGGCEVQ